jgi:N-acetylglucosaminyl-diphospho-decaprenol L-rhamnosyltransferase
VDSSVSPVASSSTGQARTLATVIVNYRTPDATIDAVAGLAGDLERVAEPLVVVVDNDSRDGSREKLTAVFADPRWGGRVAVVGAPQNGGFGAGVNFGIRHVIETLGLPRFFYVLNPDATIDPGTLGRLMAFMEDHPAAGLLGNLVRNGPGDKTTGFRFPTFLSELEGTARLGIVSRLLRGHSVVMDATESCEVDWVSGVSMLFRSETLTAIGLFDEAFFLYFEETDLALRMKRAGWKVYFVAGAGVNHIGGLSTGFNDNTRRMPRYWFDSRRRFLVKHHGRLYGAACDAAWLCGHVIFKAKLKLLRRPDPLRPQLGRDLLRYGLVNLFKPPHVAETSPLRGQER